MTVLLTLTLKYEQDVVAPEDKPITVTFDSFRIDDCRCVAYDFAQ